jgi:xanthine dehydrogenase/oxidase
MTLERGDCENAFKTSPHIISGEVRIGSQEHFYMEPQSCVAIPKGEDKEMEIISSTQNPTGVQVRTTKNIYLIRTK